MRIFKSQLGVLTETAAVIIFVFIIIGLAVASYATSQWQANNAGNYGTMATLAAQSGLDYAIGKLNNDENYFSGTLASGDTGTGAGYSQVLQEQTLYAGAYTTTFVVVSIADGSAYSMTGYEKTVTVQGRVYNSASGKLLSKRDITAGLEVASQNFPYEVQAGYGHISLLDNSAINSANSLNGRIFSNGSIRGSGSGIISAYEAGAADFECPIAGGATFPTGGSDTNGRCTAAQQAALQASGSASIAFSLSHLFHGTGDVSGALTYGQVDSNVSAVPMPSQTGYGTTSPSWPDDARDEVIRSITTARAAGAWDCGAANNLVSSGNYEVNGGLTVDNGCNITLGGNLYVVNNLLFTNNGTITVADSDKNGNPIRQPIYIIVDAASSSGNSNTDNVLIQHNGTITPNKYGMGAIVVSEYCGATCNEDTGPAIPSSAFFSAATNRTVFVDPQAIASAPGRAVHLDQSVLFSKWGYVGFGNSSTTTGMAAAGYCIDAVGQNIVMNNPANGTNKHHIDCSFTGASATNASYVNLGKVSGKVWTVGAYKETGGGSYTLRTQGDSSVMATYVSTKIGSDGYPVMSYTASTGNDGLKVLKCGNASCSISNSYNVDSSIWGNWSSLAVPADGLPVISYFDNTNGHLKVAKCGNTSCSSGNTLTTVDSSANSGSYTGIAIGSDGFPVISYFSSGSTALKVLKCNNATCTSAAAPSTVDTGASWLYTSIAVPSDGLPVISYASSSNIKIAKCGNASCSSGNTFTTVCPCGGAWTSLTIGSDGDPVGSAIGTSGADDKVFKCSSISCSSVSLNFHALVSGPGVTSIAIGSDGFPVVSYYGNAALNVWKCATLDCSSGDTFTQVDATTSSIGSYNSIAVPADGLPVIGYVDGANNFLRVLKCGKAACN